MKTLNLLFKVLIEKQNNDLGIVFYLFCPANPTIFVEPMIMFHNGSIKDNLNFKTLCPLKQKEQSTRISYEYGVDNLFITYTGELIMEEFWWLSLNEALLKVGGESQVCLKISKDQENLFSASLRRLNTSKS